MFYISCQSAPISNSGSWTCPESASPLVMTTADIQSINTSFTLEQAQQITPEIVLIFCVAFGVKMLLRTVNFR